MKRISLDVWIQLIGMVSIVFSLLFVGLQMQQSQTIALASQQQARTEVLVDIILAVLGMYVPTYVPT